MKGPMLLVTPLAANLVHTAVTQDNFDVLYACESLEINSDTGILSGECDFGENPTLTSVDLNQCLGWGALVDPEEFYDITPGSPGNALIPLENGNYTRNCDPCYLIERDEGGQAAAQLMCTCGPEGSDIKTEYSLDLTQIVSVTKDGCLECMGASGDCALEVDLNPSIAIDTGDLDNDGFSNVDELLDWLTLRAEVERTPCEDQVLAHPRLLPRTFLNTTHHRCREDHGLCCFQTQGHGCSTAFEAFLLLEGNKYWYRMHYAINGKSLELDSLSKVIQLCEFPGQCKSESTPDDTPNATNCSFNPLEDYEDMVYDNGSDTLFSGAGTYTITLPPETVSPRPTSAVNESAAFSWTKTKNEKQIKRAPSPSQRPLTGMGGR